jgi:hypothetical protein
MKSFQNEERRRDVDIPHLDKDALGITKRAIAVLCYCDCGIQAIDEAIPSRAFGGKDFPNRRLRPNAEVAVRAHVEPILLQGGGSVKTPPPSAMSPLANCFAEIDRTMRLQPTIPGKYTVRSLSAAVRIFVLENIDHSRPSGDG